MRQTRDLARKIRKFANHFNSNSMDEYAWGIACLSQKMLTGFDVSEYQEAEKYYKTSAAKAVAACKKILKKAYPEVAFKVTAEPSAIPCGENPPVIITVITESFAGLDQSQKENLIISLIDTNLNNQQKKLIMYCKIRTDEQVKQLKLIKENVKRGVYGKSRNSP